MMMTEYEKACDTLNQFMQYMLEGYGALGRAVE